MYVDELGHWLTVSAFVILPTGEDRISVVPELRAFAVGHTYSVSQENNSTNIRLF